MQLETLVNVEYPNLQEPQPIANFFKVYTLAPEYAGKNFSIMHVTCCAQWMRPELSNHSGMAVIEIDVPTGYVITNDVLRAYAQSGDVPLLRRAESYARKVVFYFDYVSTSLIALYPSET